MTPVRAGAGDVADGARGHADGVEPRELVLLSDQLRCIRGQSRGGNLKYPAAQCCQSATICRVNA